MTTALSARKVGGLLVGVAVLAVAWFLVSPLFIRSSLVEAPRAAVAPLGKGSFNEIDVVHKGRGTATVSRLPDGRLQVQLDDFSVTNGPDLWVYVSQHAAPSGHAQVVDDGLALGKLKAPEGAFGYETESAVDPAQVKSIVIYCYTFRTIFSVATLG
jgi:hypothetical protein